MMITPLLPWLILENSELSAPTLFSLIRMTSHCKISQLKMHRAILSHTDRQSRSMPMVISFVIDSCRLIGHQDTPFHRTASAKEIEPDGFIGPKQFAPRINGRQYYKNCYICGDIDFIFGSATAYFENCVIESLCRTTNVNDIQGYITAASTPESQEYGYVFSNCKLISKNCPPNSVYLGRPWRNYAKTVFLECALGNHIHECGFR